MFFFASRELLYVFEVGLGEAGTEIGFVPEIQVFSQVVFSLCLLRKR